MADWSDWYAKEDPTNWVLAKVLRDRAEAHPDRDYLKFAGNDWVSYGEVNARSNRVANALLARGVEKGESVSVMLPNTPEMVEAVRMLAQVEGILLDPVYTGKAMAGLIALIRSGTFKSGQRVLFVHTGGAPALYAYQSVLV